MKNFASGSDLPSTATTLQQSSSTNRSLGIRQTGSLGDPGGAFVLQLANTSGLNTFKLQSLDITSPRVTTWRVDYGFGPAPSAFTAAAATGTLTTGGSTFTNNTIAVDFGSNLDNRPDDVWIRIVTLTASTGSGNRASTAIDDLSITYSSGTVATPSFSAAHGNSGEIQSHFANSDWSNFNEGNDYSMTTNTTYADNALITLYQNGILIWGTEPSAETPVVSLKAFSESKGSGTNTISTFVDLRNVGNVAVDYKDVTARYWFTSEGASPLHFWIDYAKIGNSAVSGSFTNVSPVRTNANTYLELKVTPLASTFNPLTSTGTIQYRIMKSDWSNFNQLNDYSYQSGIMAENPKITIYKGQLVYGTEPSSTNSSSMMTMSSDEGQSEKTQSSGPVVYPNPSAGSFTLEMNGNRGSVR